MEKGLFPFNEMLLDFLSAPIKAFGWRKFFSRTTKIRMDVVHKFYDVKYNSSDLFITIGGEKKLF